MINSFKAVVTEVDPDGVSTFRSSEVIEPVHVRVPVSGHKYLTNSLWQVWGTSDGDPGLQDPAAPVLVPAFPGPGGTRFQVFTIAPVSSATDLGDLEGRMPSNELGIGNRIEIDGQDPAFHATATIDYCFIVDGEVEVELDNGVREKLTRGSCLVQRGTWHAWRNTSTEPVVIAVVHVGASSHPHPAILE